MAVAVLLAGRGDRLIARLKCMLYAWRFIDQIDGQLIFYWPPLPKRYAEEAVGYSPDNIFNLSELAVRPYRTPQFVHASIREIERGIDLGAEAFAVEQTEGFRRDFFQAGQVYYQKSTNVFRFLDEPDDPEYSKKGVVDLFRKIPIRSELYELKSEFYSRTGLVPGQFAALHVRRGDVYSMLQNELLGQITSSRLDTLVTHFVTRSAPSGFYYPFIEAAIAEGLRIVFASDSPEIIAEFQDRFGAEHFVDLAEMTAPIPIQKAFMDFLVLSESARIAGTSSNFSVMPGELTGVPVVNVVGTGDIESVKHAFASDILKGRNIDGLLANEALQRIEKRYEQVLDQRTAIERAQAARSHRSSLGIGRRD